jgi:G3E family GTPase
VSIGVTVVCGPWFEGTAAIARRLAEASPTATVVRSAFAPEPDALGSIGATVIEAEPELAYRTPGCACCAARLDVVDIVGTLARRRHPPPHVVIEALPHDDPIAIAQTLLAEPGVRDRVALDALVVVVHGPTLAATVMAGREPWRGTYRDAVRVADRVVVGAVESLTWRGTNAAGWSARDANTLAGLTLGEDHFHPAAVLDARAWTPERLPDRLRPLPRHTAVGGRPAGGRGHVELELAGVLDQDRVEGWLHDLHARAATRLLRFDAILSLAGRPARWLATGTRTALRSGDGEPWGDHARTSRVRLIGDGLDRRELQAELAACTAT